MLPGPEIMSACVAAAAALINGGEWKGMMGRCSQ